MTHEPIELVAFDMEGCLTADPTVWEIMHRRLGTWESHGLPYWDRYRAGGLDYDEFARMDVAVWRDAPLATLHRAAADVPLMPGCRAVLRELSARRVAVAIITNGLACVADRFTGELGVAHVFANRVASDGDRLTGGLEVRVPYDAKGRILRQLAADLGVERARIAAVGDSASDAAMFREARLGIAFRTTDPHMRAAATHVVDGPDLRALLGLLTGRS